MNEQIDYKKMYHIMVNAAEEAMKLLIEAQRECEEIYLSAGETEDDSLPEESKNAS